MGDTPLVSVIVVSYKVKEVLLGCLRSVKRETKIPYELILVDNHSEDGTAEAVKNEFPEFVVLAEKINHGFSPANNLGMAKARGKYILLLNPDTIVEQRAIDKWIVEHELNHASISGPRLLNADRSLQISAWKYPRVIHSLLELFYLHRIFSNRYPVEQFDRNFQSDFVSGAAMLFDREIYHQTNGLDPELFWMEDVDLCYRVIRSGGSCWYLHEPVIVHLGGKSSVSNLNRVISNQLISRIKFVYKHKSKFAYWCMVKITYWQVLSRILVFHLLYVFNFRKKAEAYRYTLRKLNRYFFKNDRSI